METIKIILFAMLAAMTYGIVHDQVTAHLCVEYFTIAHPPVFPTDSPFLLAIGWGIIATWWLGLALGVGLALAARAGRWPRLGLAEVRRSMAMMMLVSAAAAILAGIAGATLSSTGAIFLAPPWDDLIPPAKHVRFMADAWAHLASYGVGTLGGLVLMGLTLRRRRRLSRADIQP